MRYCKHIFGFILVLLLFSLSAAAQEPPTGGHRFSPENFKHKIDAFITDKAKLTPQEAQKFLPLYHAMKDAQRKLMRDRGQLLHDAVKEECGEKMCQKALEKINTIDRQVLDIEADYQKKMLKVISACKLLRVKDAEKKFERKMLYGMANRQKPHKK